jgi:hypothetical protein
MDAASRTDLEATCVVALIVLNLVAGAFFYLSKNGRLKRRLYHFLVGLQLLLFFGFVFALTGSLSKIPIWFVAVVALMILWNIRTTKFCDSCGKFVRAFLVPAKYCPKCGAQIK